MIMNRILVSHNDLDGAGVLTLGKFFQDKLGIDNFLSTDYGFEKDKDILESLKKYKEIIFADISLPKEEYEILKNEGIKIYFFDHHIYAKYIEEFDNVHFDTEKSGTKLFWEYYVKPRVKRFPPIIEEFVELVNTYDLWKMEDPLWEKAKGLNSVLYGVRDYDQKDPLGQFHPFFSLMLKKFKFFPKWVFLDREKILIQKSQKREDEVYKKARETLSIRVDSEGKVFGVFSSNSKISLVASRILIEEPKIDYIVVVNTWGGITGRLSFRSQAHFDCNQIGIAKGHTQACGGMLSPDMAKKLLEDTSIIFTYNEEFNEDDIQTAFKRVEE